MFKKIIHKLFFLIFYPAKGWHYIDKQRNNHDDFINNFLFPIFGVISITTFIGAMWLSETGGLHYALKMIIVVITALFGGFYLASFLINELFPKYGIIKDIQIAQQFTGYSSVIVYLMYFLMPLINGYTGLWAIPLLSFFLIYSGSKLYLNIDKDKQIVFSVISLFVLLISPAVLNYLLSLVVITL